MNRVHVRALTFLAFLFISVRAEAQTEPPRFENTSARVQVFKEKFSVDEVTARRAIKLQDDYTQQSNKIYNDPALSNEFKISSLQSLSAEKDSAMVRLLGRQKGRLMGIGHLQWKTPKRRIPKQ